MRKGFTLIELLSVIIILSIVASISVPQILQILENKKEDARDKQEAMIKSAIKLYVKDYDLDYNTDIEVSTLCEKQYISCPLKDINTGEEMTGFYVLVVENNVIVDIVYHED